MAFTFEWDPQKAIKNARKHGVTFDEAATAFGDPHGLIVADPRHSAAESRSVLLGYSRASRPLAVCSPSAVTAFASSAPGPRFVANAATMKKPAKRRPRIDPDDILPEYDFSKGRRNPYAGRMAGGHIVILEPDVAKVFPTASAVNEALRALAGIISDQRRPRRRPTKPRPRSRRGSA